MVTHHLRISRREWLAAVLLALFTTVLTILPYWLGYALAPPDRIYMHLLMNPEDALTYWAKMQQGFDGAWLYTITFTPEPHEAAGVGLFYIWLGQAARMAQTSLTAVWHGSRLLAAFVLYLVIFVFTAVFLTDRLTRWTATLLAIFGSGLGWLLFLSGQTFWLDAFPIDFKQPGAHIFFTSLTFPHIIVGTALILFDIIILKIIGDTTLTQERAEGSETSSSRSVWLLALAAGAGNILLGIAYPFLIYIIALTAVFTYLYLLIIRKRILWVPAFQIAVLFLIPAPLYLYYLSVWQTNDIFRTWDAQAGTPSPPWPHYLVGFGLMLLLAFLFWWRRPARRRQFAVLWLWIAAVGLLVYAPLGPQRRFVQGVHVALAILAAAGLVEVVLPRLQRSVPWQKLVARPRYNTASLSRFLIVLFLLFMSFSNLLLLGDVSRVAGLTQPDLFFRPVDEMDALQWLRQNSGSVVVLGEYETGNLVAAHAGNQVMTGHWAETLAYDDKQTAVAQFFAVETSDSWRQGLIEEYAISLIWFGPREQALGQFNPQSVDYLEPVYQNNSITLFVVRSY